MSALDDCSCTYVLCGSRTLTCSTVQSLKPAFAPARWCALLLLHCGVLYCSCTFTHPTAPALWRALLLLHIDVLMWRTQSTVLDTVPRHKTLHSSEPRPPASIIGDAYSIYANAATIFGKRITTSDEWIVERKQKHWCSTPQATWWMSEMAANVCGKKLKLNLIVSLVELNSIQKTSRMYTILSTKIHGIRRLCIQSRLRIVAVAERHMQ